MTEVRQHRVIAFCDWLDSIPAKPPFHTRPEFRFYADMTGDEMDAAHAEIGRRADWAMAEVSRLEVEQARRAALDGPQAQGDR